MSARVASVLNTAAAGLRPGKLTFTMPALEAGFMTGGATTGPAMWAQPGSRAAATRARERVRANWNIGDLLGSRSTH
jgi:hypothetical protein